MIWAFCTCYIKPLASQATCKESLFLSHMADEEDDVDTLLLCPTHFVIAHYPTWVVVVCGACTFVQPRYTWHTSYINNNHCRHPTLRLPVSTTTTIMQTCICSQSVISFDLFTIIVPYPSTARITCVPSAWYTAFVPLIGVSPRSPDPSKNDTRVRGREKCTCQFFNDFNINNAKV